ncbi:MAG: DUF3450 domain-containing protein [Agarilytica sp.]
MKKQRISAVVLTTAISAGALFAGVAHADKKIDAVLKVSQAKTSVAQASQRRIDKVQEETASLLQKFKKTNKQIQGLRVYNARLEKQLANQLKLVKELDQSIANVTVIERQIQPLILRMLEGLEQFVALDVPLYPEERADRMAMLQDNQNRADISVAEKFRQVLEAYGIEAEYGRTIHNYTDTLEVGGVEREVDIFAVGRIAVMYQTKDGKFAGTWDQSQRAWVALDAGKYRSSISKGIKIAKKQASYDVMSLPVLAPGAAQ